VKRAAAALYGLAFAAAPALAQGQADALAGEKLAELHCSRCHAVGNDGDSLMEGAPPLRDLKLRYPIGDLAEALAEGIVTGHPSMPEFRLDVAQINDLIAYLQSLERIR
jgi:cytochrome c